MRLIARLRLARVTLAVALLVVAHFDSLEMLPQCFTHQRGTIPFQAAGSPIRGLQKTSIENNPDCFHMSTLFENTRHAHLPAKTLVSEG